MKKFNALSRKELKKINGGNMDGDYCDNAYTCPSGYVCKFYKPNKGTCVAN